MTEGPKVAFSASLTASGVIRVFSSASPFLVYKRVITNIGNAYDSNTGNTKALLSLLATHSGKCP